MKRLLLVISLMFICILLSSSLINAQPPVIPNEKIKDIRDRRPLSFSTDLAVSSIFAANCKCDLSDVNAFYMNKIIVNITNNYEKSGGVEVGAEIKLTYFDLGTGRLETVTKPIPSIKPYPTNPWTISVTMVDRPVLVKKSTGIKAEVKAITTGLPGRFNDPDLSNNVKTVNECSVMLY